MSASVACDAPACDAPATFFLRGDIDGKTAAETSVCIVHIEALAYIIDAIRRTVAIVDAWGDDVKASLRLADDERRKGEGKA